MPHISVTIYRSRGEYMYIHTNGIVLTTTSNEKDRAFLESIETTADKSWLLNLSDAGAVGHN